MNQLNNKNLLSKVFILLSVLLNLFVIILIVRELISFIQIQNELKIINESLENLSNLKANKNIDEINSKYISLLKPMSSENTLGELLKFVENKSIDNELKIIDTKVISVTNSEIRFQIVIEGEMKNIYRFVSDIENDKNPKEVTRSQIEIRNNLPNVTLEIRGFIL